ncbi:MAG: TonB-dependent receptor domain-containing protein [Acidobacteriaceae bacterium]
MKRLILLLTRVALLCGCVALLSPFARAQYNASLQGTVTDSEGAVVPGATVTLTDNETNHVLTTTTRSGGGYVFNALPPSTYTLLATRAGFAAKKVDKIKIIAEQPNTLNVQLKVGMANETVMVNASDMPMIDTTTGQLGGTITQQNIAKLPSYGRDVFQLVQLAPGMFGDGAQGSGGGTAGLPGNQGPGGPNATQGIFVTENRPQDSGNGGRTDQNNITLDGTAINSVTWGGAAVITPSEDSIKELKVVANSYDAEYGRTGAAQIEAISQNGTNTYHGTFFFKADRPGLNAYQRWDPNNNPQRDTARFNQFGGTVGGPILHNRLFGFFSYETVRNHSTSTGGGWYETPFIDGAGPAGSIAAKFLTVPGNAPVYSAILEGANDHHSCSDVGLAEGVTCQTIAGQGLDLGRPLTGFALGAQDPSWTSFSHPGLGGDGTGKTYNFSGKAALAYLATVSPSQTTEQQFNGRVDYQATSKDLIAFNIYWVPQDSTFYNGPSRAINLFHHNQTNDAATAIWNHVFSPTALNEFRMNAAGWRWNELASNPQIPFGLPDVHFATATGAESIGTIAPINAFGPPFVSVFNQSTYSIKDKFTKVIGAHDLKLGVEGTKLEYLDEPTWDAQANYNFNNLWDFVNDAPIEETASVDPRTGVPSAFRKDLRENLFALFAQDDWKVKPNLTVNLGLRYEYFGSMYEKKGNMSTLRLGTGGDVLSGSILQLGGNQVNPPKTNFGPQLGFAWSPMRDNNKLVLRGGFGIGYTGLEMAITTNTRNNIPFSSNSGQLTGSQIVYGAASNIYQYGALPSNPNLISSFNSTTGMPTAVGVTYSVTGLPTNLPTTTTYRYSFEGQYDLGDQWVATLGYQGSIGRNLPLQTNLNAVYAPKVLAGQAQFNPALNYVDWYSDTGRSNFNALLAELHHQFSRSYELDGQYRWSKSMDNGSGPYSTPDYMFLPGYNYGPSDFDVANTMKVWGVWSPQIFKGNYNWLEKVAGGWTLSSIINMHSGFPWNPTYGGLGCNAMIPNSGDCNLRPAQYLGGAGISQSTSTFKKYNGNFPKGPASYFVAPTVVSNNARWNTNGVAVTPTAMPGTPGIGRNAFRGPGYFDTDATVTKAFGLPKLPVLGPNAVLEIRGNAYNLFNTLNLANPRSNIYDAHFGQANNVLGSRTIELEAHFKF